MWIQAQRSFSPNPLALVEAPKSWPTLPQAKLSLHFIGLATGEKVHIGLKMTEPQRSKSLLCVCWMMHEQFSPRVMSLGHRVHLWRRCQGPTHAVWGTVTWRWLQAGTLNREMVLSPPGSGWSINSRAVVTHWSVLDWNWIPVTSSQLCTLTHRAEKEDLIQWQFSGTTHPVPTSVTCGKSFHYTFLFYFIYLF